jgi:hypothetical protein
MTQPTSYEEIKALARELGIGAESLLALTPDNDPFYAERPGRKLEAEWFARVWEQLEFGAGVHLRRIHYVLVSQREPIPLPNGGSYENTEPCWKLLGRASLGARFLRLVPAESFVDRRNDEPVIYLPERTWNPRPHVFVSEGSAPSVPAFETMEFGFQTPRLYVFGPPREQRYHLEIWAEKTTMNDVLLPLAQEYRCNLITGAGELSETHCRNLVQRANASGRPVRVLYVSDFDPDGRGMPVSVGRKVEFETIKRGLTLDLQIKPTVLSERQCQDYRLPRTPLKESNKRAAKFEERFGEGATELDALEALHPGALREILAAQIERFHDATIGSRIAAAERAVAQRLGLDAITREVTARHADEVDELRAEWERLSEEIAAFGERASTTWQEMQTEMEEASPPLPDDLEWPEPKRADDDGDALYDSTRSYLDQLAAYKAWQGKPSH